MIIKISSTEDFNCDVEPVSIITDNKQLVKRAGSERFKDVKVPNHQTKIHLIALGAHEGTGINRNSDTFMEHDCRKNHNTFVKAGRAVHHNHKNKPSDPKFGDIYASDYNEPMKRIELLIGLDNDNPRNAPTLQKLSEGKQESFSMASRQKFDVCSLCGHKAPDAKSRCKHIPSQLGEITKEGKVVAMENPDPDWFEISIVKRGADRVAFSIDKKASTYDKTAQERYEENLLVTNTIFLPASMQISKFASSKRSLVNKLAKLEKRIEAISAGKLEDSKDKFIKNEASKLNNTPSLSDKTIKELRQFDTKQLFKILADRGIILNPEEFFDYATDNKIDKRHLSDMKEHLPSVYQNMEDEEINEDEFNPDESGKGIPSALLNLIKGLVPEHSLDNPHAIGRITRITIMCKPKTELKKESAVKPNNSFAKALAVKYASYKLSALNYLEENDKLSEDMMINALIQNRK